MNCLFSYRYREQKSLELERVKTSMDDVFEQLDKLAVDVFLLDDESALQKAWLDIQRLLITAYCDHDLAIRICRERDIDVLADTIILLKHPQSLELPLEPEGIATSLTETDLPPLAPVGWANEFDEDSGDEDQTDWLSDIMLKQALRAFRRRLKLKLDAATSREAEQIFAIQPPTTYPDMVWEELVKQGKLIQEGKGFFRLP